MDVWPLAEQPAARRELFEQAARKPAWDVARAIQGKAASADEARAWNAPFTQSGHRAALKAWPRVQAELPEVPAELLVRWAGAGKLWLQGPESCQAAWLQAVPQLSEPVQIWRQTQHASLVPVTDQGSAAAAVEYFAP